jgi:hypothetical protein
MVGKTYRTAVVAACLFSLILLVTSTARSATTADVPNANSIVLDNIEYYMQTDKAVYDLAENVEMLYRVTNLSNEDVEFIFTYGPLDNTCDWMVDENELRIWDNLGRPGTREITSFSLSPSESYAYTHTWDMTYKDGGNISPGNYTVTGAVYYSSNEIYVPVSVSIDIVHEPVSYVHPGESIQARIDDPNVIDGDTIIVYPGTYVENINLNGKNITLSSTDPNDPNITAATVIDGGYNGSVVTFVNEEDANCVLNGFTITNGYAEDGGGIHCVGEFPAPPPPPPPPGTLGGQSTPEVLSDFNFSGPTIKNCVICNNRADRGGGIYNYYSSPILTNCIFSGNSARYRGGAMYNYESSPVLTNCTFSANLIEFEWIINAFYEYNTYMSGVGGGIYNDDSSPVLTNCIFNSNSAIYGGGMYNYFSSPVLTNCSFTENFAKRYGGGMYNYVSSPVLTKCMFGANLAVSFYYYPCGSGGGMYNELSNPTLISCIFNGNSTGDSGGGMYNLYSSPILNNCTFSANLVEYEGIIALIYDFSFGYGGAMYNNQSSPELSSCIFNGNSARHGGGMHNYISSPILTNCTFNANLAGSPEFIIYDEPLGCGGGMLNDQSNSVLTNCMFNGNSAGYGGGGMYNDQSSPIVTNCSFIGNSAFGRGCGFPSGGIAQYYGNLILANCILWENKLWDSAGDESAQISGGQIIVDYSCIQGWTGFLGGTGNVGVDPCFVVPGYWDVNDTPSEPWDDFWIAGDYHLLPDSLCIDAGDPNYIPGPNETDLDGNPRVMSGRIDMGAYEYIPPIPADIRIIPRTITLESSGKSIIAFLWLPDDVDIIDTADIDPNGILLENQIKPEQFWFNEKKQVVISRFSLEKVRAILEIGVVEMTISVRLMDETSFAGTDVITVKGKGKPEMYVQATDPNPPDGATDVDITADLSWTPAPLAVSHDVYFGIVTPPPFVGNQTAATFDPGTMTYMTTYYWRIDEVNKWGTTTTGQVWSFTTVQFQPPPPPP